jgi:hypothetical protein
MNVIGAITATNVIIVKNANPVKDASNVKVV